MLADNSADHWNNINYKGNGMNDITIKTEEQKNLETPFTELFSLLKHYEELPIGPVLAYESENLKIISKHIDNAIGVLLDGLRGIGYLIGEASIENSQSIEAINQIGFFISAISNLTEALNDLQSDTEYVLRERGAMNY